MKKNNQEKITERITAKATAYLNENEKLLRKYKLVSRLMINFPTRNKIPRLSKIALWVIGKQGGVVDMQFGEVAKK